MCVCATRPLRIIVSVFSNSDFDVDWKLNTHEQNTAVVFKLLISYQERGCANHWSLPLTAYLGTDLCSIVQNASRGLSHPYLEIFVVVVFCSVTVILRHNWNLNQAPEKGSTALGASDSVYQTFNRPASYINIRQECPNDIHRAIINFPVISLWHKLDLMKERICLINCIIAAVHAGNSFGFMILTSNTFRFR